MAILDLFKRKQKPPAKRQYAGAQIGRLFNDFVASSRSPDEEIKAALAVLRNRCRDLARNNEYAKRYIQLAKANVVGDRGVSLQVKARNDNGTMDVFGNDVIERAWRQWGRKGTCTVDGRLSWVDAQRLFVENLVRDGEVLVRLVNYPNRFGMALEFIEPDLLDEQYNHDLPNGNKIRMGVELDKFNRPVAYHLLTRHPGDFQGGMIGKSKWVRVPADNLLHLYLPERAQQTRGVPMMAVAITSLKMLHGYREAELVAARVGASKMGVITSPSGDGFMGDDTENSHTPILDAEPGTFQQLPAGFDIKMFDPTHPTTAFADFEKAVLRGIASGLGVSYTSLASDLEGVSYSSIRQGALEDRDQWKVVQDFLIQHFVQPVFERFLMKIMEGGVINIPATRFDKFAEATVFRARGFQWVDPQREMQAAVVGLQNGILSLQDVANQYGRDVEETFDQIEAEKQMAESYGISLAFQPFGGGQSAYGAGKIDPMTGKPVSELTDANPE
jgi:lambda family phage portal protein